MSNTKGYKYKVLTWHVHGSYLYYLTRADCLFYLPVKVPGSVGYYGKTDSFKWGKNVSEVAVDDVRDLDLDCVIFQSNYDPKNPYKNYLAEQAEALSRRQLNTVAKIFIEHDPPRSHPTDTRHFLYDTDINLVHVTHFNRLMWDSGRTPVRVIEHGVIIQNSVAYKGNMEKGVTVVNNLHSRGRRLGADIFMKVKKEVAIDLAGMGSAESGGLGEVHPLELPEFISGYRFFFYPARYTSLGLAVIEAMLAGLPIVGLATTELATVIQDGVNGFISTNLDYLVEKMKLLLADKELAVKMGRAARNTALKRYGIERFSREWEEHIGNAVDKNRSSESAGVNKLVQPGGVFL